MLPIANKEMDQKWSREQTLQSGVVIRIRFLGFRFRFRFRGKGRGFGLDRLWFRVKKGSGPSVQFENVCSAKIV